MTRARSLWPREHGAYAQLLAPLLSALLVGPPSSAAILLAIAACSAFLSNEPLLVVLGHRGARLKASDGGRARRRAVLLALVTVSCGLAGLVLAGSSTIAVAGIALAPAGALVALAWRRAQHSIGGELVAACALPAAAAPVAVASGLAPSSVFVMWAAWSVGFAATVVAVHRVIARHRRPRSTKDTIVAAAMLCVLVIICATARVSPEIWIGAPLVATSCALVIRPPSARRLRAIGVALVAATTLALAVANLALRAP